MSLSQDRIPASRASKALPDTSVREDLATATASAPAGRCHSIYHWLVSSVALCAALLLLRTGGTILLAGEAIRACGLDLNREPGEPNGFALPGLWAVAEPDLAKPSDSFSGNDRQIATLARWSKAKSFDEVAPTGGSTLELTIVISVWYPESL